MKTTELTRDEIAELKEALFYGADTLPDMTEDQQIIIAEALCSDAIPNEMVHELFAHIDFVPDDFCCNQEDDDEA